METYRLPLRLNRAHGRVGSDSIAEVDRRINAPKQSLGREIENADISVLALAAPN